MKLNQTNALISMSALLLGAFYSVLFAANNPTDKQAEYFLLRCAGCHSIGEGKLKGPDLKPATTWTVPNLRMAVKKMEKEVGPLSDQDLDQIVSFLKDVAVTDRIAQQRKIYEEKMKAELPSPSYELGRKLFRGQNPLANKGPSCIACHQFIGEGGSLGPSLSLLHQKLNGLALQSAIENSSYKIMRPIYEHQKITKEEALHIAEYLSHPEKEKALGGWGTRQVFWMASVGFLFFFTLLAFLNSKRKKRAHDILSKIT